MNWLRSGDIEPKEVYDPSVVAMVQLCGKAIPRSTRFRMTETKSIAPHDCLAPEEPTQLEGRRQTHC